MLMGNFKESLQKFMHFVSTTNTWTLDIHSASIDSVVKMFSRVDDALIISKGQFATNDQKQGVNRMHSIAKRNS